MILYDETIRQAASDGTAFPELLAARGMIPGIKVDTGAKPLAGADGEKVTEGLDGLRERLAEYSELGARFAKWRAVIAIGDGLPSRCCLRANAHALARYAALCQEAGIVPIVEPEVLMDGAHEIDRATAVTEATLREVFAELRGQRVLLERDGAQAEHGPVGLRLSRAGRGRRGRRSARSSCSDGLSPPRSRGSRSSRAARATSGPALT